MPPDDASTALMEAHAEDYAKFRLEANPNLDPSRIREEAITEAQLFNQRARNWAYHEKKTVAEYYQQNRPEYRSWQPDFERMDDAAAFEWREGEAGGERQGDTLFQLDDNGNAVSPNESNPRVAKVVEVNPDLLVHRDGTPVNLLARDDMFKWLHENLQGVTVKIADDGTIQKFTHDNLNASLKRRGFTHRQAYANLTEILENALFDSFEKADVRHTGKVKGQNVYYSAAKIGSEYYTLKIKVDIQLQRGWRKYKDHKISQIEIAPSLYRGSSGNNISGAAQNKDAINGISLAVLKGDVKPSRIENDTLYQSAPSAIGRQTEIIGPNSREIGSYEVRDLDDIIASHDPDNQFRRRGDYPQIAQERPYHSDIGEQTTEDVARESQIILYDDSNAASAEIPGAMGRIDEAAANEMGLPGPGEFVFDKDKFGHIDKKHGEQFKRFGFENAEAMARYVLEKVEATYQAGNGAIRFVRRLESGVERYGNFVAEFEAIKEGNLYKITTAFPVKKRFLKHKKLLWERAPHIRSENPQARMPDDIQGQSNNANNINSANAPVNKSAPDTLNQSAPSAIGRQTEIIGPNSRESGRYEVRELDDIIASHDPDNQFRRRGNYPQIAQERPYHSDIGEQTKVIGNARDYAPALVISTDASATNGTPIITRDGIVLGGNSRTMTLQVVYGQHPEKAAAYRQMLADNASQFGIDPAAVAGMKRPMLVRVVSGQLSPEEMAMRSREYNQTMTQQLQGEAEGISRARFVDKPTINALIEGLRDGDSIDQFLAGAKSADFARILQDAGVLQEQEVAALTFSGKGASGKLNEAGKARVKAIMRGLVLPDYDVMTGLPRGVLNNLDAAIPGVALSRFRGEGYDLTGAFYDAMRYVAKANAEGTPVEHQFFQHSLISADPMRDNPAVQALAMTFSNGSEAFRFFFNHIPGNNLFYIRAALDYTFLNSFYEYLNPGYLRRMRRRVEKENGQTFWHEPAMRW